MVDLSIAMLVYQRVSQKNIQKWKKIVWFGTVKSSKSFKFIGYIIQKQ